MGLWAVLGVGGNIGKQRQAARGHAAGGPLPAWVSRVSRADSFSAAAPQPEARIYKTCFIADERTTPLRRKEDRGGGGSNRVCVNDEAVAA